MNKKGDAATVELLFVVAGLTLAAIVSLALYDYAADALSGKTLEKNFFAKDIALTLEAIYASPAEISYTYNLRNYKFYIDIIDEEVLVKENAGDGNNAGRYRIVLGQNVKPFELRMERIKDETKPVKLVFTKKFDSAGMGVMSVDGENADIEVI